MFTNIRLYRGDCLWLMHAIEDASVDMVLCDLPYGVTSCKWDSVIQLAPLWEAYKRVTRPNRAICLTCAQPFTSALVSSNYKDFKYDWVWDKGRGFSPQICNVQPMRGHESVAVFGAGRILYNPQMVPCEPYTRKRKSLNSGGGIGQNLFGSAAPQTKTYTAKHPTTIIRAGFERGLHPTQKPVALMEYLIKTYTNPGDTVLDNCMGSGTTGVACVNTDRNFIGIEQDAKYFEIAQKRIADAQFQKAIKDAEQLMGAV